MKNVLIVDDEENSRLYLANILHELYPDLTIQMASSPTEALFILKHQCLDVLLLDIEMPGMTGLELLKELRDEINDIPVIFVSAYKQANFIQKALRLNAIDYLDKPVDPSELKMAIDKCNFQVLPSKMNFDSKKLALLTEKGDMIFETDEILLFESKKRNSIAHFDDGTTKVLVRKNLKQLEQLLKSTSFERVSRQFIANTKFLKFKSQCTNTITLYTKNTKVVIEKIYPEFFRQKK